MKWMLLPGAESANSTDRHEPLRPDPSYTLKQMWERRVGILIVIRQYCSKHRRDAKVRQEDNRQRHDDGNRNGFLRVLGLFSRGSHTVKTDKSVETFCRTAYNACYTIRSESAGSELAVVLCTRGFRFPVVNVSCTPVESG